MEEYGPTFVHVKGKDNVVADALSRLDAGFHAETDMEAGEQLLATAMCMMARDEAYEPPNPMDEEGMALTFASPKDTEIEKFPMHPKLIAREQKKDKILQKSLAKSPEQYGQKEIEDHLLITYKDKVVVPTTLRGRIMAWYHTYLVHPGVTRMEETLKRMFTWPNMHKDIERHVKTCKQCQLNKKGRKSYGKLPINEADKAEPWNRVNVDMIGPYSVKTPKGTYKLRAFTMIDPATGWFEVKDISDATAEACQNVLDDVWLARYPRPQYIGFDNGNENKSVFKELCLNMGMKPKPTTTYNPQSNGIIERVHQVLNDCLRTFELEKRDLDEKDPWTPFLTAAAYAICSTYHTMLQAMPGQLVFGRDMILPIKFRADWARIRHQRQEAMVKNNDRENRNRIEHSYKPGDKVLVTKPGIIPKLSTPRTGPHEVLAMYQNRTVQIKRGVIDERVNIC